MSRNVEAMTDQERGLVGVMLAELGPQSALAVVLRRLLDSESYWKREADVSSLMRTVVGLVESYEKNPTPQRLEEFRRVLGAVLDYFAAMEKAAAAPPTGD